MYYIIVGAGHVGSNLAHIALEDGHEVALVEKDEERATAASERFDALVLHADIAESGILTEAGIERAHCLVATTGDDSANLMAMFLGSENEVKTLISIVNDNGHTSMFERLGVKVFFDPDLLVAQQLYRMIRTPSARELVALPDGGEMFDVTVPETAPIVGMTLAEAVKKKILPHGFVVVSLRRGKVVRAPNGESKVESGDHLTIFSEKRVSEDHLKNLTG
ncbi:MAG: TrkA family potassium uptake protein [Candidatus Hydrogenedentes bacterium]|nr:TrkA family potassium uptake protein [Candidatus Hydrogenedentota bacterium]